MTKYYFWYPPIKFDPKEDILIHNDPGQNNTRELYLEFGELLDDENSPL